MKTSWSQCLVVICNNRGFDLDPWEDCFLSSSLNLCLVTELRETQRTSSDPLNSVKEDEHTNLVLGLPLAPRGLSVVHFCPVKKTTMLKDIPHYCNGWHLSPKLGPISSNRECCVKKKKMSSFVRGSHLPEAWPSVQVYYLWSRLSGDLSPSTTTTMPGRFLISSGAAAPNQTDKRGEALPSLFTAGTVFVFLSLSPLLPRIFFASLHRGSVPEKLWLSSKKSAILSEPSHLLPIVVALQTSALLTPSLPKLPSPTPSNSAKISNTWHLGWIWSFPIHSFYSSLSLKHRTWTIFSALHSPTNLSTFSILLKIGIKGSEGVLQEVSGVLSSLFGARLDLFIMCQDSVPPLVVKRGQVGANCA